jgi:orotate phosphoribosyltransferase
MKQADDVLSLLTARKGHFLLESGHHGELWLDLELLCLDPKRIQMLCSELAENLRRLSIEVVCGPLVEGAFVGLLVALDLGVPFSYSERFARPTSSALFPAGYRLPESLHPVVKGKRIAIVNDVINAGSAVRSTFEDLEKCGARVVVIGTLLTLGSSAQDFARGKNVTLATLAAIPNPLWIPSACPLCAAGVPLENVAGFPNT